MDKVNCNLENLSIESLLKKAEVDLVKRIESVSFEVEAQSVFILKTESIIPIVTFVEADLASIKLENTSSSTLTMGLSYFCEVDAEVNLNVLITGLEPDNPEEVGQAKIYIKRDLQIRAEITAIKQADGTLGYRSMTLNPFQPYLFLGEIDVTDIRLLSPL
ncbi:hypothetical protein HR060_11455 [Catenovulum sp. SM1970]|uniref:hypothetical protein n=1 Tax=Marinifaba aquimaris TaxID=2741323 RepID=UPI001572E622|nr:hypothetical protein [Marinifaba aquimaris]NTS77478.1 hypothetical protein [Marinifaba aquimaris]